LRRVSQLTGQVIALGGGTLTRPEAIHIIREHGILVRLWAPVDVLSDRIGRKTNRPLMAGLADDARKAKIQQMLADREPYYSQADFNVKSCEEVPVDQLAKKIKSLVRAWQHRRVTVDTGSDRYPIFIGSGLYEHLKTYLEGLEIANCEPLIVTDTGVGDVQRNNLQHLQRQANNCRIFRFPNGEVNKTLLNLNRLYTFMLRKGFTRKTVLLQFSGGVVGDMAGFAAATYQRGIPFVQIPTTLLSMVDSSVGGKVAVNHPFGKNMIGAFYQPSAVIIDLSVLKTLPPDEYVAGLAEVVKYGVIWDAEFFAYLENHVEALLRRDQEVLAYVVQRSCEIKAIVVGQDEKENGIRAILNYGHTFGHAIEKVSQYKQFSHGLAVALGMRAAGRLSTLLGLWSRSDEERQTRLLDRLDMPHYYRIDRSEAWDAMAVDKKAERGKRIFVLPTAIGSVKKMAIESSELVDQAWEAIEGK
jgi:shikimate kinase/3-dehydroquinate synthase